jgi:nitrate/nitrite transporter NarK
MKIAMKILGGLIACVLMFCVVFAIIHFLGGYKFKDILTAFGWICGIGGSLFIVAMILVAVFWDDEDYYG